MASSSMETPTLTTLASPSRSATAGGAASSDPCATRTSSPTANWSTHVAKSALRPGTTAGLSVSKPMQVAPTQCAAIQSSMHFASVV